MKRIAYSIIGGTFDHFHIGHGRLIDAALSRSEKVTIGLTTEKMYRHKRLAEFIENYEVRKKNIMDYVAGRGVMYYAPVIIPLINIFGNALTDKNIEAIFVTKYTYKGSVKINEERKKIGFPLLEIVTVSMVKGNDGKIITSERIRKGEIDRQGHSYPKLFKSTLKLPDDLREELRKPIGEIIPNVGVGSSDSIIAGAKTRLAEALAKRARLDSTIESKRAAPLQKIPMTIAVGDIISQSLIDIGQPANISIIDFKTGRNKIQDKKPKDEKIINYAGTINVEAVRAIKKAIDDYLCRNQLIVVDGEEDLLTLPAIMLAPLGAVVFYGQFGLGAVRVKVTEEKKKLVKELLSKFNH